MLDREREAGPASAGTAPEPVRLTDSESSKIREHVHVRRRRRLPSLAERRWPTRRALRKSLRTVAICVGILLAMAGLLVVGLELDLLS